MFSFPILTQMISCLFPDVKSCYLAKNSFQELKFVFTFTICLARYSLISINGWQGRRDACLKNCFRWIIIYSSFFNCLFKSSTWNQMLTKAIILSFYCSFRALTRPHRGCLTAPSQLKLAEYFPNWVFPKFLNPIKLKKIIGSLLIFAVISYSLTMIIYWLQYCIKITKTT